MKYLKSKTLIFNILLALVASVNAFIPFIPPNLVTPVLLAVAVSGMILRILTVLPLSDK